jgi:hypothetical protein
MRMSSQNTSEHLCDRCVLHLEGAKTGNQKKSFDPVLFLNPGLCLNVCMRLFTTDQLCIPLALIGL